MNLNNHIVKADDSSPIHSNGYAIVANGDRMGSTANISFEKRLQIENSRKNVGAYNRSFIGRSYGVLRLKTVNLNDKPVATNKPIVDTPKRFNEPKSRPYNPYS